VTDKTRPENDPRRIRLSEVGAKPKTFRESCMVVKHGSYQGRCPFRASKLIGDTAEYHGLTRTISYLMPLNSEKTPGDVLLVPTDEETDDNLPVEWANAGKEATVDMIQMLAHKKITIPEGSNMIIELYPETDPVYEKVIGMRFVGATFEAQKERPRKTGAQAGGGKNGNQGPNDNKGPSGNKE